MDMLSTLSSTLLKEFVDLKIQWATDATEAKKWADLQTNYMASNYIDNTVSGSMALREELAKSQLFNVGHSTYALPTEVFNPLNFVGDPRD